MSSDLPSREDFLRKLPAIPMAIPDRDRPTIRATSVLCESDGGSFTLVLAELRPWEPYTPETRFAGASAYVEVGRFVLSPVAFQHLKKTIEEAEAHHVAVHGPLPELADFYKKVSEALPDRPPAEVEQRLGFRG